MRGNVRKLFKKSSVTLTVFVGQLVIHIYLYVYTCHSWLGPGARLQLAHFLEQGSTALSNNLLGGREGLLGLECP